jgi:integrase/recombinase XerD
LQRLLQFASERLRVTPSALSLEQRDAPRVLDFLPYLETERHNGPRTRNARLVALKAFLRFVEYRQPALLEPSRRILALPAKRTDKRLMSSLSREDMQAVRNTPHLQRRDGLRDRAMLHLCLAAGLRVSELGNFPLHALEFAPAPSVRIHGKGRRARLLPLWKQTAIDLRAWLAVRGAPLVPALFVNARTHTMTRSGCTYVLPKHVQGATAQCASLTKKQISPQVLRHTAAMLVLQATGDIRKVSLWLGHADMQTTEASLRADPTENIDAMSAVVPPTLRRGQFRAPDKLIASLHGTYIYMAPTYVACLESKRPFPSAPYFSTAHIHALNISTNMFRSTYLGIHAKNPRIRLPPLAHFSGSPCALWRCDPMRSDAHLLQAFEDCSLPEAEFHHATHIRVA